MSDPGTSEHDAEEDLTSCIEDDDLLSDETSVPLFDASDDDSDGDGEEEVRFTQLLSTDFSQAAFETEVEIVELSYLSQIVKDLPVERP